MHKRQDMAFMTAQMVSKNLRVSTRQLGCGRVIAMERTAANCACKSNASFFALYSASSSASSSARDFCNQKHIRVIERQSQHRANVF